MLLQKISENKFIRSLLLISVIIGAFITIGDFINKAYHYYYDNISITRNISKKLVGVSTGQSINHFKKVFGNEITTRSFSSGIQELIFKYKTSYIQTLVDASNTVIFLSITDCNNPIKIERPIYMSAYSGNSKIFPDSIILNKTKFADFVKGVDTDKNYFYSGATANSYYYESVYLGNPAGYQTIFVGVNDICSAGFELCMLAGGSCDDEELTNYRQKNSFTTYGESSPFEGLTIKNLLKDTTNNFYLGPDRISFRVFND